MGLFNKMKNFFSGFKYKMDREILREYLQHTIDFAVENKLPFCDEFYIVDSLDAKDRLHVTILNYDVPGDAVYEIEKSFEGIVIFANHEKEWFVVCQQWHQIQYVLLKGNKKRLSITDSQSSLLTLNLIP